MSDVAIPHFDYPFDFKTSQGVTSAAVVEQDTDEDIFNCVNVVLVTHIGERITSPEFGITDPTFDLQPVDTDSMLSEIGQSEPRAEVLFSQAPNRVDQLNAQLRANVRAREE